MNAPCKITEVAELLGLKAHSKSAAEWRFGNKGSLCLDLNIDCFYDHEHAKGGGVLDLIQHLGHASSPQEAVQFLKAKGLLIDKTREVLFSKKQLREHIYVDGFGQKIRKSVKYNDGSRRQFEWSRQNWAPEVKGVQSPPYGLDRLLNKPADNLCFFFRGRKRR